VLTGVSGVGPATPPPRPPHFGELESLAAERSRAPQGVRSRPSTPGASTAAWRRSRTGATAVSARMVASARW
jgi:hypothetical protein